MNLNQIIDIFLKNDLLKNRDYTDGKIKISKLKGDASTRNYFRIRLKENLSQILCFDPNLINETDDCIRINNLFKKNKIPVPELIDINYKEKLILQEDLGSFYLSEYKSKGNLISEKKNYSDALDLLFKIQNINIDSIKDETFGNRFFDKKKLMDEVSVTVLNLTKYYGPNCYENDFCHKVDYYFNKILKEVFDLKECLVHRDYHSRNIMVKNKRKVVIDYQDARIGSYCYDLASLLEDPYNKLSESLKEELKKKHYKLLKERKLIKYSYASFNYFYDRVAIQRLYKALGTYFKMAIEKNNFTYLPYVGNTVEELVTICQKDKSLAPLVKLSLRQYYEY